VHQAHWGSSTAEPSVLERRYTLEAVRELHFLEARTRLRGPADLVHAVAALFPQLPPWAELSGATAWNEIELADDVPFSGRYQIARDGTPEWLTDRREEIVPTAEALVTVAGIDQLVDRYIIFHAGAVSRSGRAILLPAASGAGKSTLVAALVACGFTCLGDDTVLYDPGRRKLLPLVRSITLKAGSTALLAPFYTQPLPEPTVRRFGQKLVTFVTPGPDAWPREPVAVAAVVVPERTDDRTAELIPLSRAEMLPRLLAQCSSHQRAGARAVQVALDLIRQVDCWVLRYGRLDEAVELLESALA
jgi:hypothetical protein